MNSLFASPGQRFGAFFIDQVLLGAVSTVTGLIIISTQINALNAITRAFVTFSNDNTNVSGQQLQVNINTFLSSDAIQSSLGTLIVPFIIWLLTNLIISIVYYTTLTARNGQTLGKKFFHIQVTDEKGKTPTIKDSFERYIIFVGLTSFSTLITALELFVYRTFETPNYLLSLVHSILDFLVFLLLFIGVMMVLNRKDRRGYHDISAGTRVIKL